MVDRQYFDWPIHFKTPNEINWNYPYCRIQDRFFGVCKSECKMIAKTQRAWNEIENDIYVPGTILLKIKGYNNSNKGNILISAFICRWRWILLTGVLFVLFLGLFPSFGACDAIHQSSWFYKEIRSPSFNKPTDIHFFQGRYVLTEHLANRLAMFPDFRFSKWDILDPSVRGCKLSSPHFFAVDNMGRLLISNGKGDTIVSISDSSGADWKEFQGIGKPFHLPHGIAVDPQGWIYVGDSGNSRIVRFRDMEGTGWEVFSDVSKQVAYARQLVWKDNALWVSNTYEKLSGLNPGKGANVLRIDDFRSGRCDIVYRDSQTHFTGILPLGNTLLVGLWGDDRQVVEVDLVAQNAIPLPQTNCDLGVPYGFYEDQRTGSIIVCYFGDLEENPGGLMLMRKTSLLPLCEPLIEAILPLLFNP
jgi:hypothetical protein